MSPSERPPSYDPDDDRVPAEPYDDEGVELVGEPSGDPDVLLDVPQLSVDEIHLEVEDLQARVSLQADVLDLLKLNVGADVFLGRVQLDIKGVEARALLKVRLDRVAAIISRVLATIDRNPQILEHLVAGLGSAVSDVGRGARTAVGEVGRGAGTAVGEVGRGARTAVGEVGRGAGSAVGEVGRGAGSAVGEVGHGARSAVGDVGRGAGTAVGEVGHGAGAAAEEVGGTAGTAAKGVGRTAGRSADEVGRGAGRAARDAGRSAAGAVGGVRDTAAGITGRGTRARDRYNEQYDDRYDDRKDEPGGDRVRRGRPERKQQGRPP